MLPDVATRWSVDQVAVRVAERLRAAGDAITDPNASEAGEVDRLGNRMTTPGLGSKPGLLRGRPAPGDPPWFAIPSIGRASSFRLWR
jgi:hypothetical protein